MRLDDLYLWHLGDPATPRYVGALKLVSAGKGVSLHYGKEWLANGFALSEDLPLVDNEFLPPGRLAGDAQRAVGAVDDARPDRWGEKVIRFVDKPTRLSLMEYLHYAGHDRVGALGVATSSNDYRPRDAGPLPRLKDAQQLSEVAAKIEASEPITTLEARIIAGGGSPLGGAKPKALIDIDGEQWVIKFFNNEPVDTPLIEHATMTLAERAGITVARTQVIHLAGANAVAILRFDRAQGRRIHSISAGTAIRAATPSGVEPEMGYPELARILRRVGITQDDANQRDARELFRRMVFNILVDNTDDHEKNHSLLVVNPFENGRLKLAPAYDILPTNSGQGQQEFICGADGRDSTLENAMSQCDAFGLAPAQAAAEVAAVIDVVDTWKEHFAHAGLTERDIDSLAERIDGDTLLTQRTDFDPARFQSAPIKRKRTSPFRRPWKSADPLRWPGLTHAGCGSSRRGRPSRDSARVVRHRFAEADLAARRPLIVERQPVLGEQHHDGGAEQEAPHLVALLQLDAPVVVAPFADAARPRRVDGAVPHRRHAADDRRADEHQHPRPARPVEQADDALVAREQPGHAARGGRVHREQVARHMDHPQQPAGARHVDAVIVARAQVQRREPSAVEARGQRGIAADQRRGGVVVAFRLQDAIPVDRTELADRAVHRADQSPRQPAAVRRA